MNWYGSIPTGLPQLSPTDSRNVSPDLPQPPEAPGPANGITPGRALHTAALLCAVALLWLATRPYFGTVLDARFYMVQGLHALDPARFAEDLYFKFGSQGNFSLFTKLYVLLLPAFGVGATGIILTVAGQLLWLFGLFRLARSLVGGKIMWLSVAMVIGMLHVYAGGFGYGEGFATARPFAEGLVMLGLALLSSRPRWTVALLTLSAAIHPLMTLPGIAVAFVYMALGRPIWWAAMGTGAGLTAALGLAGIAPFSNLFRTIDPEWFAVINVRSSHLLLTNWPAESFAQVFGVVAWAVAALFLAGPSHRRFLAAALMVGVGGLVCTYLGGDIAHNLLVVEIQSWRSIWLLQLVSRVYVPLVLMALLARTSLDSFRWATLLTVGLILAASVTRLVRNPHSADFTLSSLALVVAALAVMAVHLLLAEQKYRRIALVSVIAGFALIPVALSRWDVRSPWTRYVDSPEPPPKDITTLLPAGASVYWEGGIEMLWLRLKRPSYFSCEQGTGAVFYRETAMAYKRRAASFWPLRTSDFKQSADCLILDKRPKRNRTRTGLQGVCAREPGLDYLVLTAPLDGVQPKVWKSPVRFQDIHLMDGVYYANITDRFYIYSCASVR
ncbi:MAG: hypothetical protein ABI608_01495 [Rhizomicrobium sp.]